MKDDGYCYTMNHSEFADAIQNEFNRGYLAGETETMERIGRNVDALSESSRSGGGFVLTPVGLWQRILLAIRSTR